MHECTSLDASSLSFINFRRDRDTRIRVGASIIGWLRTARSATTGRKPGGGQHALFRHRRDRLHRQAPRQEDLLARKGAIVYFLLRAKVAGEAAELLCRYWGVDEARAIAVVGDLTAPRLGVDAGAIRRSRAGSIEHFFHLAAIYDLAAERGAAAGRERRGHAQRGRSSPRRSAPAASTT